MGQLQPYSQTPYDSNLSPETNNFHRWLQTSINNLIGVLYPLPAPTVTTEGFAGAVQVSWNEVPHAGYYVVYETDDQNAPTNDVPVGTVPANRGGTQNSFLRSGIGDDTTRFYWVQPFSPSGVPGKIGGGIEGTATSFIPTGLSGPLIEIGIDSALQQVREDFISGGTASGLIGAFGFSPGVFGSGTVTIATTSDYPFLGILALNTTTSNGSGAFIAPYVTASDPQPAPFGPLNNLPLGAHLKAQWIAQMSAITGIGVRMGFAPVYFSTLNERSCCPGDFIGFEFDTSAGFADLGWKAVARKQITTISSIAIASNVVTITTSGAHGLTTGDSIAITGVQADNTVNGYWTVTVTGTTTFTFPLTHANATPAAASGAVSHYTRKDTLVTPITDFLRFEIESAAPGVFAFRISNGTSVSNDIIIDASAGDILPTASMSFLESLRTRNGAARVLNIDYIGIGFDSLIQPDPTHARWF